MARTDTSADRDSRYRAIMAAGPLLIFTIDRNGFFTLSEGRALERLGRKPNEVRGKHIRDVYADNPETVAAVDAALCGEDVEIEVTVAGRSFEAHYSPTHGPDGTITGVTGVAFDITERVRVRQELRESEERYRNAATHDSLTGLPNRTLFMTELTRALAQAQRHHQRLGVAYVDLDGFKAINDSLGHMTGDRVLQKFAQHLASSVRAGDLPARLAGDEFAVLLNAGPDAFTPTMVAERLSQRVQLDETGTAGPLTVRASVGIAIFPDDGDNADSLLRVADQAMYMAKRSHAVGCPIAPALPQQHAMDNVALGDPLRLTA